MGVRLHLKCLFLTLVTVAGLNILWQVEYWQELSPLFMKPAKFVSVNLLPARDSPPFGPRSFSVYGAVNVTVCFRTSPLREHAPLHKEDSS